MSDRRARCLQNLTRSSNDSKARNFAQRTKTSYHSLSPVQFPGRDGSVGRLLTRGLHRGLRDSGRLPRVARSVILGISQMRVMPRDNFFAALFQRTPSEGILQMRERDARVKLWISGTPKTWVLDSALLPQRGDSLPAYYLRKQNFGFVNGLYFINDEWYFSGS